MLQKGFNMIISEIYVRNLFLQSLVDTGLWGLGGVYVIQKNIFFWRLSLSTLVGSSTTIDSRRFCMFYIIHPCTLRIQNLNFDTCALIQNEIGHYASNTHPCLHHLHRPLLLVDPQVRLNHLNLIWAIAKIIIKYSINRLPWSSIGYFCLDCSWSVFWQKPRPLCRSWK